MRLAKQKVRQLVAAATAADAALAVARTLRREARCTGRRSYPQTIVPAPQHPPVVPVADGAHQHTGGKRLRLNPEYGVRAASSRVSPSSSVLDEEPLYQVEALLKERRALSGGTRKFRVRWLGYGARADSWESETNIAEPELIRAIDRQAAATTDSLVSSRMTLSVAATALARATAMASRSVRKHATMATLCRVLFLNLTIPKCA